MAADFDAPQA